MPSDDQIAGPGDVRRALDSVPRVEFVPEELRAQAGDDRALPIACGQTISQPAVVAYMTEQLRLRPGSRVLEVGTGSGYQAAVLAALGVDVYSVERIPELARTAAERLQRMGYGHVRVRCGDGNEGWPDAAPFDAIIVTAAAEEVPAGLVEQLARGGRLIIPVGSAGGEQQLLLLTRGKGDAVDSRWLWPVRFVPLLGGVAGDPGCARELRGN